MNKLPILIATLVQHLICIATRGWEYVSTIRVVANRPFHPGKTGAALLTGWTLVIPEAHALENARSAVKPVSAGDMLGWSGALLLVLIIFFLCIWLVRKVAGLSAVGPGMLRVVGGLSLGVREKVVLLQVGEKQLLLGVSPGRIETLQVLEGEDCLVSPGRGKDGYSRFDFSRKLKQAMQGASRE